VVINASEGTILALDNGSDLLVKGAFRYRYVHILPATTTAAPTAGISNFDFFSGIMIVLFSSNCQRGCYKRHCGVLGSIFCWQKSIAIYLQRKAEGRGQRAEGKKKVLRHLDFGGLQLGGV
jgi:hypothetical protein